MKSISEIVDEFREMTDRERYVILSALLDGKTEATGELRFRAYLCTALREAGVYPQEGL